MTIFVPHSFRSIIIDLFFVNKIFILFMWVSILRNQNCTLLFISCLSIFHQTVAKRIEI